MSALRFKKNGDVGFITLTDPPDNKIGRLLIRSSVKLFTKWQ